MGIRKIKKWTIEEIEFLQSNFSIDNKEVLINKLDRTWAAIKGKYKELNTVLVQDFSNTDKYLIKDDIVLKKCNKCLEFIIMDRDHYDMAKKNPDGYTGLCKVCCGRKYTDNLTKPKPREGYKFCIKCNRELPINVRFFPQDKAVKTGFRNVCRECGADGHFMDEDYIPITWWSKEENERFKELYPKYSNEELIEKFYKDNTAKELADRAYHLGVRKSDETYWRTRKEQGKKVSIKRKGIPMSESTKRRLSETRKRLYREGKIASCWKGRIVSDEEKERSRQRVLGRWLGENNPQFGKDKTKGNNPNWKGGKTPLNFYMRNFIKFWKEESMKACDYRCVVTGTWFNEIHHLTPFNKILEEILEELKIDNKTYSTSVHDYSSNDIENIEKLLIVKHKKYGLGVCLDKEIHKLFHDLYGYKNADNKSFDEFKRRYDTGEFDNELSDYLSMEKSKIRFEKNIKNRNLEEVV